MTKLYVCLGLLLCLLIVSCTGSDNGSTPAPTTPPPPTPPPPPQVTCTHTVTWENPTENIQGYPLRGDELQKASLYVFAIPMAQPEEVTGTHDFNPYLLTWVLKDVPVGQYYYRLTVWNLDEDAVLQESDFSNEISKLCS